MFAVRVRCYVCDVGFRPRNTSRIIGDENALLREYAITWRDNLNRPPLDVDNNTRICFNCRQAVLADIRLIEENPRSIDLNILRQTRNGSCFICNAANEIHRLSDECKAHAFIECGIFFPRDVRSCNRHLDDRGYILRALLPGLQFVHRKYVLEGQDLVNFLNCLRQVSLKQKRFENINDFDPEEIKTLTSLTLAQFNDLYRLCLPVDERIGRRYVYRKDLLLFLCKMRQGVSDKFLAVMFNYSDRDAVCLAVATVRRSLMENFVPLHLGFNSINREQFIAQHVPDFANRLYNPNADQNRVAILCIDATYTYCHKSSNFRALRQSYCRHKGRHLIKPALIVAPDGYILDIHEPYFSDAHNNDASIEENELTRDDVMINWLQEGDIVVVDRGYRDVIPLFEDLGLVVKMPPLLQAGEQQLTTEDANEAKKVTKTRWIVEAKNGHMKLKFKLLNLVQPVQVLPHIGDFYKIAGAIMNAFHPMIHMNGADNAMAQRMNARAMERNLVQERVLNENLRQRNAQRWVRMDAQDLDDFPNLTIDFLKNLTEGVYQVGLAPSYVQDKLQREGEVFEIEMMRDENRLPQPGFLRARICSRFVAQAKHMLWIEYIPHGNVNNAPITGYYCTCRTGARTLGTCAHITSALWYLGYAKNRDDVSYPSHELINTIQDAANRPPQVNPP